MSSINLGPRPTVQLNNAQHFEIREYSRESSATVPRWGVLVGVGSAPSPHLLLRRRLCFESMIPVLLFSSWAHGPLVSGGVYRLAA